MADAVQLLNSAAQVTSDAFGRIERNLDKTVEVNQQIGQFQLGMAAKAIEFAERKRMDDAQIEQMRFGNELQARKYDLEAELLPMRAESERLRLEAYKMNFKNAKDKADNDQFNNLTSIYDNEMSYALAKTGSPDQAQAYLAHKASWKAKVMGGEKFSDEDFRKGMTDINSKFDGMTPAEKWDGPTSHLFHSISPSLGGQYDQLHPAVVQSKISAASSYLDTPDSEKSKWMSQNDRLFPDKSEIGSLAISGDAFQRNNSRIEKASRALDMIRINKSKLALSGADEEAVKGLDAEFEYYDKEIKDAIEQNKQIRTSILNGDFKFGSDKGMSNPDPEKKPVMTLDEAAKLKEKVSGFSNDGDLFEQKARFKVNDIHAALGKKYSSFIDDLGNWFADKNNWEGGEADDKTRINWRNNIEEKLDSLDKISDIATPERINALLGKIDKPVGIPISRVLAEDMDKAGLYINDNRDNITQWNKGSESYPYLKFGGSKNSLIKNSFTSYEDIEKSINALPRKDREEAMKEIFAALTSAALTNSVK